MSLASSLPKIQVQLKGHPINQLSLKEVVEKFKEQYPKLQPFDGLRMRAILAGIAFPVKSKGKYFVMLETERCKLEEHNSLVQVHNSRVRKQNALIKAELTKNFTSLISQSLSNFPDFYRRTI